MHWIDSPWVFCPSESESPLRLVQGNSCIAQNCFLFFFFSVLVVLGIICAQTATAQPRFGAQGAEAEPGRMQQWLVPSLTVTPLRMHCCSPTGDGPFRLALIAHASTQNVLRRAQMPQPEYRALRLGWSRAVLRCWCRSARAMARPAKISRGPGRLRRSNYSRSGYATADSIKAALSYLREQPFIRQDGTVIVGHSAGAWGALALAGENPQGVAAIIAFASGRGGHANGLSQPGLRAAHAGPVRG